jgi:hypothetical protein
MEPVYMAENRYSYLLRWRQPASADYESEVPETQFERTVQTLFSEGQRHLVNEEYYLALNKFREVVALILKTVHPKMPVDPSSIPSLTFPFDPGLVEVLAVKTADLLKRTPATEYAFPTSMVGGPPTLPATSLRELKPVLDLGLQVTSFHGEVRDRVQAAIDAIDTRDWATAIARYNEALQQVPASEQLVRASLLHDLAILNEKAGFKPSALELGQASVKLFGEAKMIDAQVQALDTASGIFRRAGDATRSAEFAKQAAGLRASNNIRPILLPPVKRDVRIRSRVDPVLGRETFPTADGIHDGVVRDSPLRAAVVESTPDAPALMMLSFLPPSAEQKAFNLRGASERATIVLDGNAAANVKNFLTTLANTGDLQLLTGFVGSSTQWVAHRAHMYYFLCLVYT